MLLFNGHCEMRISGMSDEFRRQPYILWVALIALTGMCLRFVALEQSPVGFYVDEAAIAAQIICLRQSGSDNYDVHWPIFSEVLGGGYATPSELYLGAVWTSVFGDSIASFRSFAALHGALTVMGVFMLALALWRRRDIAWLAALCCAISPWAFQFSRIAWDPPLAPCYLVWGLALILYEGRAQNARAALGGFMLSLACYSYPSMRLQAVLLFPIVGIVCFKYSRHLRFPYLIAGTVCLISAIPLIQLTLSGEIQGRFNLLSITSDYYLEQFGGFSLSLVMRTFFENIFMNLSPEFLFFSGDGNLRHSTQAVGEWSWLEILAFIFSLVLFAMRKIVDSRRDAVILFLLVWAYFAGITPAAMTWESNPHALRSIGAFPFLSLASAYVLGRTVELWGSARYAVVLTSVAFSCWYFPDLFFKYPERSGLWFDRSIVDAVRSADQSQDIAEVVAAIDQDYPELALRYFILSSGAFQCEASSDYVQ